MTAPIAALAGWFPELPDRTPRSKGIGAKLPDRAIRHGYGSGHGEAVREAWSRGDRYLCSTCGQRGHKTVTCGVSR